jgi:hypothetical protein
VETVGTEAVDGAIPLAELAPTITFYGLRMSTGRRICVCMMQFFHFMLGFLWLWLFSTSKLVRPKVEDTAKERLEVIGWSETIPNKENNGTYFHYLTNN